MLAVRLLHADLCCCGAVRACAIVVAAVVLVLLRLMLRPLLLPPLGLLARALVP
jgi:hypothetical protein